MPVFGISWHDATAYCAWRSVSEGRTIRLPSETEWDKAARGVDGRWYPWGNRFDASLANMNQSRRERSAPVAVEEFPRDVSVYGVRGMAGNVRDWTATEHTEGRGAKLRVCYVIRGGAWGTDRIRGRSAYRLWLDPFKVYDDIGFRVAADATAPDSRRRLARP